MSFCHFLSGFSFRNIHESQGKGQGEAFPLMSVYHSPPPCLRTHTFDTYFCKYFNTMVNQIDQVTFIIHMSLSISLHVFLHPCMSWFFPPSLHAFLSVSQNCLKIFFYFLDEFKIWKVLKNGRI